MPVTECCDTALSNFECCVTGRADCGWLGQRKDSDLDGPLFSSISVKNVVETKKNVVDQHPSVKPGRHSKIDFIVFVNIVSHVCDMQASEIFAEEMTFFAYSVL